MFEKMILTHHNNNSYNKKAHIWDDKMIIILHGYDIVYQYVWYQQLEVGEIMSMHNILPKYVLQ